MATDWDAIERRREETRGPFEELSRPYLHLTGWSTGRTAKRLEKALRALREYRWAHNQEPTMGSGDLILGVRVVADELAAQIQEKAGPEQDPATIAWVLAGMRCPSRPFCTGCSSCFTITAPNRPIDGQVGIADGSLV